MSSRRNPDGTRCRLGQDCRNRSPPPADDLPAEPLSAIWSAAHLGQRCEPGEPGTIGRRATLTACKTQPSMARQARGTHLGRSMARAAAAAPLPKDVSAHGSGPSEDRNRLPRHDDRCRWITVTCDDIGGPRMWRLRFRFARRRRGRCAGREGDAKTAVGRMWKERTARLMPRRRPLTVRCRTATPEYRAFWPCRTGCWRCPNPGTPPHRSAGRPAARRCA